MPVWGEQHEGREAVVVAGDRLRATVLPGLGAKVVSLVDLPSGRELLWQDPRRPAPAVAPGAAFADGDRGGVDDCFPTVDPCAWPGPGGPARVADHGEVWTRAWDWEQDGNRSILLGCRTGAPPFRLERRVSVTDDEALRLDYALTVEGDRALPYQWTGHPLLAATAGMVVELPAGAAARTGFAAGGRVVADAAGWRWPLAPAPDGGLVDVSRVLAADAGLNEKYWLAAPPDGCRLVDPGRGAVVLAWDAALLPHLAVCVDYGGWPSDAPGHWVALEPATSPHDRLDESWDAGAARELAPGETARWWWSLAWEPARPTPRGA